MFAIVNIAGKQYRVAEGDQIKVALLEVEAGKKVKFEEVLLADDGKKFQVGRNYFNLSKKGSLKEAANNLYKTMREVKKKKFKSIAVIKIPNKGIGYAINDRLKKASNK